MDGMIPSELVDENLRTDIGWIRRLTLSQENSKEMPDALVIDDELSYNVSDLSSKFNKRKFFDKNFYPVSLFYLGMTTLRNNYRMVLPNLTMRSIYMDYYNEMNHIEGNAQRYVPTYERFTEERRFRAAGTKLLRAIPRAVPGAGVRQDQRELYPLLLLRALLPLPKQLLYVRHRAEQLRRPFRFRDDRHTRHELL